MSWNFALILFIALVVTGVIWTIDKFSCAHDAGNRAGSTKLVGFARGRKA